MGGGDIWVKEREEHPVFNVPVKEANRTPCGVVGVPPGLIVDCERGYL